MCKPDSGHFHGANGKSGSGGGGSTTPLFNNGKVTYESIAANREEFMGKSVEQIAELLRQNDYTFNIRPSKHKDSTAQIIEITNASKLKS